MAEFPSPAEQAAYWHGRHDEAATALAYERARVDQMVVAAVKWAEPGSSDTTPTAELPGTGIELQSPAAATAAARTRR
jgi:hypothetical protein